jgi:type I restriction enzyme S subunit
MTVAASELPCNTKLLRITDIQNGKVNWEKVPFVEATESDQKKYGLRRGDIVFARTGATTGKSFLIRECPEKAVFASYLIRVRLKTEKVEPAYLSSFFNTPLYWNQIKKNSSGSTQAGVNSTKLKTIKVPLPPLSEQSHIAAILDTADALREKRRQVIAKLDELLQAVFLYMFGDPKIHSSWERLPVEQFAVSKKGSIRTGPFGSQLLHSEFVDRGVSVLGIDNAVRNEFIWEKRRYITKEKYQSLKRYKVYPDDVIITIMGTCGRCAIIPKDIPDAINTKHLCCITLNKKVCLPEYLHGCFLMHPEVLKQLGVSSKGAVMPGLNMKIIKELKIPLAPLPQQKKYTGLYNLIKLQIKQHKDLLVRYDDLFFSLQQRAFKGEL